MDKTFPNKLNKSLPEVTLYFQKMLSTLPKHPSRGQFSYLAWDMGYVCVCVCVPGCGRACAHGVDLQPLTHLDF